MTHSPIEEFLRDSDEKYHTIYIDTWDAIYHEYLPHLNELSHLGRRLLQPGGEILLWAYDMMVRQFMDSARNLLPRRTAYLQAGEDRIEGIRHTYPLLHRLVDYLRTHPDCPDSPLLTHAYRLATRERNALGILKLTGTDVGGLPLLQQDIVRKGVHGED